MRSQVVSTKCPPLCVAAAAAAAAAAPSGGPVLQFPGSSAPARRPRRRRPPPPPPRRRRPRALRGGDVLREGWSTPQPLPVAGSRVSPRVGGGVLAATSRTWRRLAAQAVGSASAMDSITIVTPCPRPPPPPRQQQQASACLAVEIWQGVCEKVVKMRGKPGLCSASAGARQIRNRAARRRVRRGDDAERGAVRVPLSVLF
eukprot:gene12798-biopygen8612